jgi:hypothetical protein
MTQLEPELLADGAILVPVTQGNGQQTMVRLEPGQDEHAAWLGYMQRQRPIVPPPPPPPAGGVLARRQSATWWALVGAAVAVVGGFGPWATALNVIDVSGTKGDGWFAIVGGLLGALVVWRGRSAGPILAMLLGAIIAAVGLIDFNDIQSRGALVHAAWGIYAVIAGGATLSASGLALLVTKNRTES